MRRIRYFASFVVVCLLMSGQPARADSVTGASLIRIEPVSFGVITRQPGEDLVSSLKITNISDEPVTIRQVSTGCGCIQVDFVETRTLPAGGNLDVPIRAKHMSIKLGPESITITVLGDGGAILGTSVATYTYAPILRVVPNEVLAETSPTSTEQTASFEVIIGQKDLSSDRVTAVADDPSVVVSKGAGTRDDAVKISVRAPHPHNKEIKIVCSVPGIADAVASASITFVSRPPIIASPDSLLFGTVAPVSNAERTVEIRVSERCHVQRIEADDSAINVSLKGWPDSPYISKAGELLVLLKASAVPADRSFVSAKITVHIDQPEEYDLVIPLSADVRR